MATNPKDEEEKRKRGNYGDAAAAAPAADGAGARAARRHALVVAARPRPAHPHRISSSQYGPENPPARTLASAKLTS